MPGAYRRRGRRPGWRSGLQMGLMTFLAAFIVGLPAQTAMFRLPGVAALGVVLIISLTGIFFDMLGVAATAAHEVPFHARASRRMAGAREGIWLVRHADRVAAFSNDVVGDICGTINGAAAAALVFRLAVDAPAGWERVAGIAGVAVVAGVTVGGKAAGKSYALSHADDIISSTGRFLSWWQRKAS